VYLEFQHYYCLLVCFEKLECLEYWRYFECFVCFGHFGHFVWPVRFEFGSVVPAEKYQLDCLYFEQENYPNERFSVLFSQRITNAIGELIQEVSEGFYDNVQGLEEVYKAVLKDELNKSYGAEFGSMAYGMLGDSSWNFYLKAHQTFLQPQPDAQNPTKPANTPMNIEEPPKLTEEEEKLLRELEQVVDDDSVALEEYEKLELTKNYLRGDVNYKPEKEK